MPMKRKISTFLFGLLFLIGFGILIYPTVSNQWNTYRQNQLISSYDNTIQDMEPEDFTSEWENAKAFNDTIQQNNLYGDVFGEDENDIKDTEYWKILNVADDGVMGYLSIPKINIKLAIYHGTGDDELQTGVGHLNGTKLPIGGESTHSVLAAHRGLPSAKLFTDIDQLKVGLSSRDLEAINADKIYCLGICWPGSLDELMKHTEIPVYILEDVYFRFKGLFDTTFAAYLKGNRQLFIVTDQIVPYEKYLDN